ncbi:MAG: hypothetical protein ABWX84_10110 [Nocardioides sp.]
MASLSTIYSVGTLLSRAEGTGQLVRVLVEGSWISGTPVSCDGYGAILDAGDEGQFLVRVEAISAVAYLPAPVDVPQQRAYEASYESPYEASYLS